MRVAIVGGGVGGAALALALDPRLVTVSVHEHVRHDPSGGSALGLAANGLRVLRRMGLEPALRGLGAPIPTMRLLDERGVERSRYDVGPGGLLGVRRAALVTAMTERLPADVLHHGPRCVDVTTGPDTAGVEFADGSTVEADVVVGADGIHSGVADRVAHPPPRRVHGHVAYRGLAPRDGLPPELTSLQNAWVGSDRHLLSFPAELGGRILVSGFAPGVPDDGHPGHHEALTSAFRGWARDVEELIARTADVARYDLADRAPFAPWFRGRIVLVGDAAHPMLPHMGQGANQAIEDAAVLAALLNACPSTGLDDVTRCLATYQRVRTPRTDAVQAGSRRNGELLSGGRTATGDPESAGEQNADNSWIHQYDAWAAGGRAAEAASVGGPQERTR